MNLTAEQVRQATLVISQIIREARPMPQRGKFRLARLHMKLLPEFNTIETQRDALIKIHGIPLVDPATGEIVPDKWEVPPANMADFTAAYQAVADEEIGLEVTPIPIGDLDNIEANELIALGELVAE